MDQITQPWTIRAEDVEPHYNWDRALPAPGTMASISRNASISAACTATGWTRARQALKTSNLGALLLFDVNNIRYVTGTKIGEWERDKLCRFALLPATASRSCGISARPPCITASTATGSRRRTAAPACSACAAPSRPRSG